MTTPATRARPLAREERRAAIVTATIPLLLEYGTTVTTRQIAHAAGVAEGTLFSVFTDKSEIIHTAVVTALNPAPLATALRALDTSQTLPDTLAHAVGLLAEHQHQAVQILSIAHQGLRTTEPANPSEPTAGSPPEHLSHRQMHSQRINTLLTALTDILSHYQDELRPAPQAALVLFSLVTGNTMSLMNDAGRMDTDSVVDVILHGIAAPREPGPRPTPPHSE